MRGDPQVSVLLPVHNAEPFLDACLDSLCKQTLDDFEIVAVDDGSTDASPLILASRARSDSRVRVIRQPHMGLVAALNRGLSHCTGDFVARMDADDLAHPERMRMQADALCADPAIDVLSCRVSIFASQGVGRGFELYEAWLNSLVRNDDIQRDLYVESPLPHPSVMMKRDLLRDAGGYRDLGWPEDYDLWLRLAARGCRFEKLENVLLHWRDHGQRLTRTDPRYAVERFLACKAHHLATGPLRGRQRVLVWGAGQTGRRLSKHLLRHRLPLEAFVDIDVAKSGRTLRRRPIVLPDQLETLRRDGSPPVLLAAVASRGARKRIRRHLETRGWRETQDFWCVA
ncbi:MAG: glycosyltransferase [Acidobacteriota bacterium]|nr:glycosyltransferase [Acidobacteriota bacterium]